MAVGAGVGSASDMPVRAARVVLLVTLLHALSSCRPLDAGPDVQRALTAYAPDLILGASRWTMASSLLGR